MNQRCSLLLKSSAIALLVAIAAMTANPAPVLASYDKAPIPLSSAVQLVNMTYSYNPQTQTLTKQYQFKNISGQTLLTPRLVNLFLWSNTICSADWMTMGFNGTSIFSNTEQAAAAAGYDGTIDWSSQVYPYSLSSTELFPSLPLQSVQSNTSYPYWNIASPWNDQDTRTINVQFSNVLNCNWVQNVVWVIYSEGGTPPTTTAPPATTTTLPATTTTAVSTTTTIEEPTVIELSEFRALPGDRAVTLIWRTESEIDTAGFNIYRGQHNSTVMTKINAALIPAKGSAAAGAEYSFTDSDVSNGVIYVYKLEDVDTNGVVTQHKSVLATPRWIYSLFHQN
jgi:hypothetical protein